LNYFITQPLIKKLFFLFPLIYLTGPFLTDLSILIIDIIFLIYLKKNFDINKINKVKLIFIPLVIFWIISLLNSLFSFNNYEQIIKSIFFIRFIIFSFFIFYYSKENFSKTDLIFIKNIIILAILILVVSVYFEFLYHFITKKQTLDRYSGIFFSELIAGSVIFKFICYYFLIKFRLKDFFQKNDLFLIIIILPAMVIINERANLILFISLITFLMIFYFNISKIKKVFLITSFFFVTLFIITNNEMSFKRYSTLGVYIYSEVQVKIFNHNPKIPEFMDSTDVTSLKGYNYAELFYGAIKVGLTRPYFGVSFRNYRNACAGMLSKSECNLHPHNYYLEIFAEHGFIGLFLILLSFCYLIRYIFISSNHYCLIIFLINFWPLVTTGSYFNNYQGAFNALIIGAILINRNYQR